MSTPILTRDILEGYVDCKYLAHLRLMGQAQPKADLEQVITEARLEQKLATAERLRSRFGADNIATDIPLARATLPAAPSFLLDAELHRDDCRVVFDGIKKVNGSSDLGKFHYVPILTSVLRDSGKLRKNERILLEVLGVLLSQFQRREPSRGIVYHGASSIATSVPFTKGLRLGRDALHELTLMQQGAFTPNLLLNDHCHLCEFKEQCRAHAMRADHPTLLRGLGEQQLRRYARRGLFTLTQIAHTFRPRRSGRHDRQTHRRDYALQALAIRDNTVYVLGTPDIPPQDTEIYVDVEGNPDQNLVYLIGMVVCEGGKQEKYSFWADTKQEEKVIFDQFVTILSRYKHALIYCYGSYEKAFITRMQRSASRKKIVDQILGRLVNVLSTIYRHVYFPTYSNGLKEIGALLGFSWTDASASGAQSIAWRMRWQKTRDEQLKAKLLQYNLDDCEALMGVVRFLRSHCAGDISRDNCTSAERGGALRVTSARELENASYAQPWTSFTNADFAFINKRAYFDYQRLRVYARTGKTLKRRERLRQQNRNRTMRASQKVEITAAKCPECGCGDLIPVTKRSLSMGMVTRVKRALDLRITQIGVRRRVVEYRAVSYRCARCESYFAPGHYHRLARHFHNLMSWVIYLQVAHGMSMRSIQQISYDLFGLTLTGPDLVAIRSVMARRYRPTYGKILKKLISGAVLHADETEIELRTGKAYVWVFTSAEDVFYTCRPTREGRFLRQMLEDFRGVLVSDFYTAYDALQCPQQKCLIHLIRDMNQDVLGNPFDTELHSITDRFGALLRSIVTTIDAFGLKRKRLRGHSESTAAFLRAIGDQSFTSHTAQALQRRLLKNRDRLFTFLDHDGVSWNNSNAEHAIKQLSSFREKSANYMKAVGLDEHLVLMTVYQTCRYHKVNFLKFLLSRSLDIDLFAAGRRPRRRQNAVELYPQGYFPPHIRNVRLRNTPRPNDANDPATTPSARR
jgi:predicted RecB family nuclease